MLSEGIRPIGDGLLEVAAERLQGLLVTEDINEIYDVEQTPFARGKFAAVRRAVHKKTGVHFAAKFLRRRRRAQCTLKEIGHEIAILMLCADSKHIVKLNAVHESKMETALILELATGGELQAILDEEGCFTEQQAQSCMREILKALQYLHKKYIAHLDLKPQNILLCGDKVEDGLKLCDFGISRIVEEGGKVREILGTPDYVAPEVLQYEPLSLKTDIWSVGVLTYVLLTGCSPFGGDTKQETFLNISQCALTFPDELFEDVSPVAIDFIKCALRIKPQDRMSAVECLEHRWLNEDASTRLAMSTTNPFTESAAFLDDNTTTTTNGSTTTNNSPKDLHSSADDTDSDHENGTYLDDITATTTNSSISCNAIVTHTGTTTTIATIVSPTNKDCNKENILSNCNNSKYTTTATITNLNSPYASSATTVVVQVSSSTSSSNNNNNNTSNGNKTFGFDDDVHVVALMPCDSNTSSSRTTPMSLFPDAPTTPKVCRKSSPDSPPSVKALVKKFQLDTVAAAAAAAAASTGTDELSGISNLNGCCNSTVSLLSSTSSSGGGHSNVGGGTDSDDDSCAKIVVVDDAITAASRCCASLQQRASGCTMPSCGGGTGGCRHMNGRKSIGLDQGIIC